MVCTSRSPFFSSLNFFFLTVSNLTLSFLLCVCSPCFRHNPLLTFHKRQISVFSLLFFFSSNSIVQTAPGLCFYMLILQTVWKAELPWYGSHVKKKKDSRLLIGRIVFSAREKCDTRHLIGGFRLLRPACEWKFISYFSFLKSYYVYSTVADPEYTTRAKCYQFFLKAVSKDFNLRNSAYCSRLLFVPTVQSGLVISLA